MHLEVCIDTYKSAKIAINAGADRLEVCSRLDVGGLTPTENLLDKIERKKVVPYRLMFRPEYKDFIFREMYKDLLKEFLDICHKYSANGIVAGYLTEAGEIDTKAMTYIKKLVDPLPVTFHMAFDETKGPIEDRVCEVIDSGCDILLTTGRSNSAEEGIRTLSFLIDRYSSNINILPGKGICSNNIISIHTKLKHDWYHGSFSNGPLSQAEEISFLKSL